MSIRHELPTRWELRAVPGQIPGDAPAWVADAVVPGEVPGVVHTDLLAAGLIPDPYLDENESDVQWIARTAWEYRTELEWTDDGADRVDLVCDGLDTVATVELNGARVASTQNMHRSYRFDVADVLREGTNTVVVRFASALEHAERERDRLGALPIPNTASVHPINFVRKMASSFGWDWGPVLTTAGIWRPIALESWSVARLDQVRPAVTVDGDVGRVRVALDLERGRTPEELTVRVGIGALSQEVLVPADAGAAVAELVVPDPDLWWPRGQGAQPLYDLTVTLTAGGGSGVERELGSWQRRIGFRTVELRTEPDDVGTSFALAVNGREIFVRGANWIPDDCFPSRVSRARYRRRVEQAVDANIDLLRVWGGGIYESDAFYDACDELGVLVWQDFLFACAAYPEAEPIRSEVVAEATENVARLMPHASLALWNGNNENFMGWHEWGWPERIGGREWGLGYYLDLLPTIVADVDGTRPYWPGSPYSGSMDRHTADDDHGCSHVWDVWNTTGYDDYRARVPRFASEFGWQGPPAWSTLTRAVHDDPLLPDSPGALAHQKATDGNGKLARGLAPHFPEPVTMEDWHFANQLNQSRAIAVEIEHLRSHRGRCMGSIVWQLNDCWPVTSWAAIDGDGRPKPLWYTLRRVYADHLVTVQPRGESLEVFLVNDATEPWPTEVLVQRLDLSGTVRAHWTVDLTVPAGDKAGLVVPPDVATPEDPAAELLVVSAGDRRATWFFVPDKDFAYPVAELDIEVLPQAGADVVVRVSARTFVRDLVIFADRLAVGATVDEMLVTLFPGESTELRLSGVSQVTTSDLVGPVVRTANDLVVRAAAPRPHANVR
ncbi:glycoside hydrolase family 2 protein [Cellulomonas sp. PhB143]|uniref:glycoside hydrolase family 2 protein n=1 Tax=Cellulomonas sp. PhB143 TaxID=2485186 RepID=UPI000F48802A|nr:glycoside hydrolase family 2 protein [Cellulomonas sp. PhB143]ROS79143.1 beta-mannosidase [Cellulomonas sp. PhB143]